MFRWIQMGIVTLLLIRAVYTDLKIGKIENRLIGFCLVAGVVCIYGEGGTSQLLAGIKMMCAVISVLFFLFIIKGLGAGDIKLLGVLALFFPEDAVSIIAASFFTGAVIAGGRMLIRACKKEKIYKRKETLNFSVPIALGTGAVKLWNILC